MRISAPREIKPEEARVGLTPTMVTALVAEGHEVFVAEHAGEGAGFSDESYRAAGARITSQEDAWAQAELLVAQAIEHLHGHDREADLLRAIARYAVERDR